MNKSSRYPRLLPLSVVAVSCLVGQAAWAVPVEANYPFHYRESYAANQWFAGGDYVGLGVFATPNPYTDPGALGDATTVTAQQGGVAFDIPHVYTTIPGQTDQYGINRPYDASLTGPWTLTINNPLTDNQQVVLETNSIENVDPLPFVKNIYIAGSDTDLTVSWDQPESDRVNAYGIAIWDADQFKVVHLEGVDPTLRSFQIPQQFNNGTDVLTIGTNYVVSVRAAEFVDINGTRTFVSSSQSFFNFTPTEGTLEAYLPTIGPDGYYNFNVQILEANEILFFDPLVAIGYDYLIGEGNPNFASVLLPDLGDGLFDLWLFDQAGQLFDSGFDLLAGIEFDFLTNISSLGLDRFRILGIEKSAGLDPGDVTAFVTGLSFVSAGEFTGQMRPIVENVPEPATLTLFGLGLASLGFLRRRRAA